MLHEFIAANRAAIIARTQTRVAERAAPRATADELATGIPLFLDQLIETLRLSSASTDAMAASAAKHGRDLLARGFTVAQVVHDYGGVCQSVTELADETEAAITAAEFNTFNRCLDNAIAQAVTEYTRQREQLITSEGAERWGALAHELRNSLGAAMLSFQTLQSGRVGVGGSTAALLDRSLRRLSALVESSIAHVRIESGRRTSERVSMRELVEDVEVGASMEANAQNLTLSVGSFELGVDVAVDRQLLAAAIANLLQNAFKFTHAGGHVALKASWTRDRVLVAVHDECGGLPPGNAEALFQPFEQRGANRKGMGLGLAISRKSVEADGGEIRVKDVPGVGCVFTIDLPRLATAPLPV
jgi:signal transduction histidine kinase